MSSEYQFSENMQKSNLSPRTFHPIKKGQKVFFNGDNPIETYFFFSKFSTRTGDN